ncbi:MAG: GAF domain-containing protein [Anaerolineaceae bacterium]|nr:GAF domain-containing protein [Anaerolineaceae bacterium]
MQPRTQDEIKKVTSELSDEFARELLKLDADVPYIPVPHPYPAAEHAVWRVRLDLAFDSGVRMGLDINDEIEIGRGGTEANVITLFPDIDIEKLGVSRSHARLSPTAAKLFIMDLNSTNGTAVNGRRVSANVPQTLSHGDYLKLGRLEFIIRIIQRPKGYIPMPRSQADLVDILPTIGRAITSQLNRSEVLKAVMDALFTHMETDEVSIWLVDDQTGELFQEAGRGLDNEEIKRLPVTDTLAGQVIESGQPLRVNRQKNDELVKVKTGYLVEALLYVPLVLGGVTFGVIAAAQHDPGKIFTDQDEKLMMAVAEFTAAALQNARLYQAVDQVLICRSKIVSALHSILSYDLRSMLNATLGYAGLLHSYPLDEEVVEIINDIVVSSQAMNNLIEQLTEITALSEASTMRHEPTDLIDIVQRAVSNLTRTADAKSVQLDLHVMGEPYMILSDSHYLYRAVLNLVDNAVKFSPPAGLVSITLAFSLSDLIIRVQDSGPGIPEEHLPYLFEKYFRGKTIDNGSSSLGLGLELVRATVEGLHGTVLARNHEDGGAEFIITLPATTVK